MELNAEGTKGSQKSGTTNLYGNVQDLYMYGGMLANYGTIARVHHKGGYCCFTRPKGGEKVVFQDRVVEKVVYKDRIVYRDRVVDDYEELRLRLEAALDVNRKMAEKIRYLERFISEYKEKDEQCAWDNEPPSKAVCKRLLRQFDLLKYERDGFTND